MLESETYLIYVISCPARAFISLESSEWCRDCDCWHNGIIVGDFFIQQITEGNEVGAIKVTGSGFYEVEGENETNTT